MSASSLAILVAAACSSSSDDDPSFVVRSTNAGTAATSPVSIAGRNAAYLADEATTGPGGTDLNLDGDVIDSIAVALDISGNVETTLGVAARNFAWISSELYLVVDEALDLNDWNNDADMTDVVLLHWSKTAAMVTFVDTLDDQDGVDLLAIGTNLFYTSATAPVGAMASNVRVISTSAPLVSTAIPTTDLTDDLSPRILGEEEGLIFLALDETVEGRSVNGDGDMTDTNVLALLDGTDALGVVRNTELALPDEDGPFRANLSGSHNWQVGFLVSETAQGGTNLNDPVLFSMSWQAPQCAGDDDVDTTDDVLHYISFSAWNTNPVTSPPRNTGLVGKDRIAIANSFVATITEEADEGPCDLNGDGDTTDDVVRWTQIVAGMSAILPLNAVGNVHALFDVPGGTHGLAECDERFVIVVSEADEDQDLNGDTLKTFNLIGWLSPSASATPWDFQHGGDNAFVGASWVAETFDRTRLNVAFEERVGNASINTGNTGMPGDMDILDSIPTFADFGSSPTRLNFPGVAIAVDKMNAGMVISRNNGFYRVDETEDSRDWNADGDETDFLLWRTDIERGTSSFMSVANSLTEPVLRVNRNETNPTGGVFIADESLQGPGGTDLNGDGDTADLVLRYVRF